VAEAITQPEPAFSAYQADDGVTVEPYIPTSGLDHLEETAYAPEPPIPSVYVPSRAERPEGQQRMPRTEELPAVARKSLQPEERHEAEPRNARALFAFAQCGLGSVRSPNQGSTRRIIQRRRCGRSASKQDTPDPALPLRRRRGKLDARPPPPQGASRFRRS
jgi:cell division protein FtsZ